MKSKKIICAAVAVALTMGVAFSTAGCIVVNNEEDVKQQVATVDITKNEQFKEVFSGYESAITEKKFVKRDMLVAFFNGYYQYVQSYGYSMEQTFDLIANALTQNAVITQYAVVGLLKDKIDSSESGITLEKFNSLESQREKYEYLLGGENSDGVKKAKYELAATLNEVLDSGELNALNAAKGYDGTGTRTTPSGIDTVKEEHIPEYDLAEGEFYPVYTGYEGYLLTDTNMAKAVENGDYEPLEGTNRNTRRKAYASFVSSLKSNYLLTESDNNTTDIMQLSYVQDSYISQLEQVIIDEYNKRYEEQQEEIISKVEDGVYTYIKNKYDGVTDGELTAQEKKYSTISTFEADMGNLSDTSFILYAPNTEEDTTEKNGTYGTYGYVYNILLPFSAVQNVTLSGLQSSRDNEIMTESDYFYERNKLLKNIETTDQREAWLNGETQYAFNAAEYPDLQYFNGGSSDRTYLFFENNITKPEKYEELEKYIGLYSYNGKVTENSNGSYKLVPNKLDIDGMLKEFSDYINYVLGDDDYVEIHPGDSTDGNWNGSNAAYYGVTDFTKNGTKEIDYSKLVYATGKIDFKTEGARETMFVTDTLRYKAMSAVNELQYAYTTDTSVLSQYIGYTVSAYETSYIAEFEYAAQEALRMGAGTFKVCAGDYGWHLIYVTETFDTDGGEVYDAVFSKERVETEGTFENRFYNWCKDSALNQEVSYHRAEILKDYNTETAVKIFKSAYKNLT